ncbi:MAG TPA: ArsR family transcriptional regulator [Ktedonobacterales bacterium]|jgi:predicted ArsR family transcriptional regulator
MSPAWSLRFLTSTRGRLIALLRRDTRTVDELASALSLTDNAVRAHLAALERDGIVRQCGVRRDGSVGKPAFAYELTADAEHFFPKPYAAVLNEMLAVLDGKLTPDELERLLRSIGSRMAGEYPPGQGDARKRLEAAVDALNQIGGLAEVDVEGGNLSVRGYSCPLAAVVPSHPDACRLAEAFVSEVAGVPVRECCDRSAVPHCRFELAK